MQALSKYEPFMRMCRDMSQCKCIPAERSVGGSLHVRKWKLPFKSFEQFHYPDPTQDNQFIVSAKMDFY